jgi:hypothetical protein
VLNAQRILGTRGNQRSYGYNRTVTQRCRRASSTHHPVFFVLVRRALKQHEIKASEAAA